MENINDFMPLSNDWNKERLDTLKQLMPDLFTSEGKLNIDEFKKIVDPLSIQELERYEFRWFGKSQAKRTAFTPSNATLIFDEHRSVNPSETENIIIEGENLEVLKLLSGSYREKIKCIYIDPPYNTGKDFVYSDNFTQDKKAYWEDAGITENGVKVDTNAESDGRYHSNWLNMMYSRLLIARQLLKEDGVIFISIDDNEVHNLRKLCDEVFGDENMIGTILWKKKTNGNNMGFIPPVHDYILIYAKSYENIDETAFGFPINEDYIKKNYSNFDNHPKGLWTTMDLSANHKGPYFPIKNPETNREFYPADGRYWVFNEIEVLKRIKDGRIIFGKNGNSSPTQRVFLVDREQKRFKAESWWDKHGMNEDGTTELKEIFGVVKVFDHSKPSKLLKNLVNISSKNDDLLLDFFSGTGTLGHAVTELNKEDGGNRKYILVQIPEATDEKSEAYKAGYKKISSITIERNKRVIANIVKEKADFERQITDLNGEISDWQLKIQSVQKQKPTLALGEDSDSKEVQGFKQKITLIEGKIAELTERINKIDILDKGFKVFQLTKSNFPRVEFAPDPDKTDEENIALLRKYISEKEAQLYNQFNQNELMCEILLKKGFLLNYTIVKQKGFTKNDIFLASDGDKELLVCLDTLLDMATIEYFKEHTDKKFLCLERALDTTKKWNLKHYMGDKFIAF
jgi:adenine-specific DNA-methyltransferase